ESAALKTWKFGINTVKAASGPPWTKLPSRSATWLSCTRMTYDPRSNTSHDPPGGVIEYVTVRGAPFVRLSTLTNVAGASNPFGPVTRTAALFPMTEVRLIPLFDPVVS